MYGIKSISDKIVENYHKIKKELKFDGEYLNYFAALKASINSKDVDVEKIKVIRRSLSEKTPWHSSFRGAGLYIISILLSYEQKGMEKKIERLVRKEAQLASMGFREGSYLALACYILEESGEEEAVKQFNDLFHKIRRKNTTITWEDDYPVVALMVSKRTCHENIEKKYNECFNLYTRLEPKSSNIKQNIVNMSLVYNEAFAVDEGIMGGRIEHQFAVLYPLFFKNYKKYSKKFEICEDLLENYAEMKFFMDSSFRRFLVFSMVIISEKILNKKEANEMLALCILNFIKTQEMSVLREIT